MDNTVVKEQEVKTPETENTEAQKIDTPNKSVENTENEPYKVFSSKEDFDRHSAGILNNAKYKAEKELLAMLGLKPDEKDKLQKFKESYEASLSDSEKQAQRIQSLESEVSSLRSDLTEKDAIIFALGKMSGKNTNDVLKYVRMAKGLVDDNTSIDVALEQVFSMTMQKSTVPVGKPLPDNISTPPINNPFASGNMTQQGTLIKEDKEKARDLYFIANGRRPSW